MDSEVLIDIIATIPDDVWFLICHYLISDQTFYCLAMISKKHYHLCATIGKKHNLKRLFSLETVAFQGYLAIFKMITCGSKKLKKKYKLNECTFSSAVKGGHMNILIWLNQRHCKFGYMVGAYAAKNGDLVVLKWLFDNKYPMHQTCEYAAEAGHLHVLMWCIEHKCLMGENVWYSAAMGGHLHILQWMMRYLDKCPWNERTTAAAAKKGHLEILKWLIAHECQRL